jgi:hypothetical protein
MFAELWDGACMENLAVHFFSPDPPSYTSPAVQRLITYCALSGFWISLRDPEEESEVQALLPEMDLAEDTPLDEIRGFMIDYATDAGVTPREMKMLLRFLGVPILESRS